MVVFHRIFFVLIIALFVSTSCQDCSDPNCKKCSIDDLALCTLCQTNYVLLNSACSPCNSVLTNCAVCNDTALPIQCVSCSKGFYGNSDFSTCDTCSTLIKNCSQCQYQAPFQKVQCNQCVDNWNVSDDRYTCIESTYTTIIIIVVVAVVVVALGLGGFFLRRWLKKKKLENPLIQEEEYQKAG